MSLHFYNGKVLFSDGGLALASDCCCDVLELSTGCDDCFAVMPATLRYRITHNSCLVEDPEWTSIEGELTRTADDEAWHGSYECPYSEESSLIQFDCFDTPKTKFRFQCDHIGGGTVFKCPTCCDPFYWSVVGQALGASESSCWAGLNCSLTIEVWEGPGEWTSCNDSDVNCTD